GVTPGRERRRLAVPRALLVDQLPDDAVLDDKAPARLGNAHAAIAGHEAVAADPIEKPLPLRLVLRLGREPRGQSQKLLPGISETVLGGLVGIDEARVWVGPMREHDERRVAIEPCRVLAGWHERRANEPRIALRQQREEASVGLEVGRLACRYDRHLGSDY